MRLNEPVTGSEYRFPAGETLVSVTDLKGRITYCNGSFIQVSGFARHELMGQPHNIVRHPDMPAEAFRDLWDTVQAGLPWTGLVKNRRKNGDHYWVQANATPMMDGDRITGFLSVRTVPEREAVVAAEGLYARMRDDEANGRRFYALRHGELVRCDWVGQALRRLNPGPAGRVLLLQVAAAAAVLGAAALLPAPAAWATGALIAMAAARLGWQLTLAPLVGTVVAANRLAAGDLVVPVPTGSPGIAGQMQKALQQLSVNLRTVVLDTRREIEQVNEAAHEIASGNHDLSSRTESQASNLEQTAASMEEITATVRQSADAAQQGAQMAEQSASVARRSHEAVQAVALTMGEISESSRRMGDIVHVIEGVAFQTNILALNAAVEAARAGDAGRGFAVVASEVRALSQRTAAAVREIRDLIHQSAARVELGNTRSTEARERMDEALTAVGKVGSVLQHIASAAREQQTAIAQVNAAVTQMDGLTQQNAAMVEELASAAQSLQGQVDEVQSSMRLFRLQAGDTTVSQDDAVAMRREAKALAA
ncbi:Chemotaxis protein [Rubrivivax sp. A210]|uniref:methyl-accepting chemotaxis protein n=1 Tax=Rubrivivax sp. A210 TaxID=2772301 RepID=UPI00191B7633|nr:PAS domain-containing methyl-accepting chemotaxis protein [Rubrivivax sp. A210]CAD5374522.1 Chemotaxis protein [Rubrivivax sp. A210]